MFLFFRSATYLSKMEECLPVSWAQFVPHVFSKDTLHFFSSFFLSFYFFPAFLSNIEEQHQKMCSYQAGAPELPSLGIYHGCSTGDWLCCFIALTTAFLPCSLLGILSEELPLIDCCRHNFESWGFLVFWDFYFPSFCELPLLADSGRYACAESVFSVPSGITWLMWRSFTAGSQQLSHSVWWCLQGQCSWLQTRFPAFFSLPVHRWK